jgi:nucleoside triphosphate pyrophosphatase
VTKNKLFLASTSPRRRDLLGTLKIPFQVVEPLYEESPSGLPPSEECLLFAEGKARSVASRCGEGFVLGADTLIECEGVILGKPKDAEDAVRILSQLSGKTHRVHTAVILLDTQTGRMRRHVETAKVSFRRMTGQEIRDYVATGEPQGKAGAYAVQGRARQLFIENVEGDEEAVIGLPVALVKQWLQEIGLI